MGRRLRTTLPVAPHTLKPMQEQADIRRKEAEYKRKMAENYNKRHRAIPLPALKPEQNVHIRDRKEDGVVQESANNSPRSYNVKTPCKTIRRNRRDLILIPNYRKCER